MNWHKHTFTYMKALFAACVNI